MRLLPTMPSKMSLVAAFLVRRDANRSRARTTRFTEPVTVPLDQQLLKHPVASRSLRTGWPQ
jgi:hypothetical protein